MTILSAAIPTISEESCNAALSQRVLAPSACMRDVGVDDLELLIVNDGSSGQRTEIARRIAGVNLIQHLCNRG